jgi:hypothetical protein
MASVPIAFRTNESKYSFLGEPKLINCYAEQQGQDAKAPLAVVPCPGLVEFDAPTDRPGRGTIYLPDLDCAYVVHSTSVYKITYDGTTVTATRIGVIPGTDPVQMSRNGAENIQVSIHCDAGEFYIQSDVVLGVTDTDLVNPDPVSPVISQDGVSGYTVYGLADRRFFISSIDACQDIDGTDYATAEQSAGPLVRVKADRGDLFLFKTDMVEPWRNTGNADFPFEPMPTTIQKGLLAANAVASVDNTLVWPGHDDIVYRLNGSNPQRISNHGIERKIKNDTAKEDMLGFEHSDEGHQFYTLTGTDWTRTYDAATGAWHSRESYGIGRWRARFPFRAWGKTIFQDELTGKLLELDSDTFTEDGDPMIWGVDFPVMHAFPHGAIVDTLHLDVATGVGTLPASADGYAPVMMLSWSTDGGATFTPTRELSLGAWGDRVRVSTHRLGRFGVKGIIFRLRISDPVVRALVGADVSLRPLKR